MSKGGGSLETIMDSLTTKRIAIAAAAAAGLYVVYRIGSRVNRARTYWQECRGDTVLTPGVKCKSWAAGSAEWFRINDVIMGGKSSSCHESDSAGRLLFTGTINTNGGGFAALRTCESCKVSVPSSAQFVKVVAAGDGQQWKVTLGTSHALMSGDPVWSHDFHTEDGVVKQYLLPLSKFTAGKRGRRVDGAVLTLPDIEYIGLALSLVTQDGKPNPHFGDGPFKLVLNELNFV